MNQKIYTKRCSNMSASAHDDITILKVDGMV